MDSSLVADAARVALIGIGATAVMDAWAWLLRRLGVPGLDMALVGRWVGHFARGRWRHEAISRAAPVHGEAALGWTVHYAVGVAFAAALVAVAGVAWAQQPSLWPALALGVATVAAPLFVMQPAMGAGFAASRTPSPARSRLRSLANHTVFGAGLYAAAAALEWITR